MNDELCEEIFAESMRSLTPSAPDSIKARLLYECGASAAQAKLRRQQWRSRLATASAVLIAFGAGMFFNQSPTAQPESTLVATAEAELIRPKVQIDRQQLMLARNSTTLTAAMPLDRVIELINGDFGKATSNDRLSPHSTTRPLGTLSYPSELN